VFLNFWKTPQNFARFSEWPHQQALQCTFKYGHLRISLDVYHVRMTDIEGVLTKSGHSDNLLNNNVGYLDDYTELHGSHQAGLIA